MQVESPISLMIESAGYSESEVSRAARMVVKFGIRISGDIKASRREHRDYFESYMRSGGWGTSLAI